MTSLHNTQAQSTSTKLQWIARRINQHKQKKKYCKCACSSMSQVQTYILFSFQACVTWDLINEYQGKIPRWSAKRRAMYSALRVRPHRVLRVDSWEISPKQCTTRQIKTPKTQRRRHKGWLQVKAIQHTNEIKQPRNIPSLASSAQIRAPDPNAQNQTQPVYCKYKNIITEKNKNKFFFLHGLAIT
jgi:hypothetical protein